MTRRPLYVAPALLLLMACGSDKLTPKIAEALISPDYPVVVPVKVPKHAMAEKGSPELSKIETINGLLTPSGWFRIQRREEGTKVHFDYAPSPSAPTTVQPTSIGFNAPAVQIFFVKALRPEGSGPNLKVPYQVRLEKTTALFPLFQLLHPKADRLRHARIIHQGKDWALMDTDEEFKSKNQE